MGVASPVIYFTFSQLLFFGVHIGHAWKMSILFSSWGMLGLRNSIWIIDLFITVCLIKKALGLIEIVILKRGNILFINHKRVMSAVVLKCALWCGQSVSTWKWVNGLLTNFKSIYNSLLKNLLYCDSVWGVEEKWRHLEGLSSISRIPNIIFVSSMIESGLAVSEARTLRLPIISILDSNCDSRSVSFPIPGNDDSVVSIRLYHELTAKAVVISKLWILQKFAKILFSKVSLSKAKGILSVMKHTGSGENLNTVVFGESKNRGRKAWLYACINYRGLLPVSLNIVSSLLKAKGFNRGVKFRVSFEDFVVVTDYSSLDS